MSVLIRVCMYVCVSIISIFLFFSLNLRDSVLCRDKEYLGIIGGIESDCRTVGVVL